MIGRYTRPEMRDIWTEQRKLEIWLEIELLAAKRLGGEQFNLQPDFELSLLSPDVPHLGTGVASNHPPTA